ncbi:MAG: FAD-binding protein [Desulfobacteraceae bacterium]|nr:MAG: FAD-binding protein [Desulfobacteraceae bacterium]
MDDTVKQALIGIVGKEHFTDSLIDLVSFTYDSSDHAHRPQAAVWPENTEQISRILHLANKNRFPVTPRGAGTSLAGTAVPVRGGLVLDLSTMNRILDIRIADRLAVVEPGVVYDALNKALGAHGFFFPPDPASGKACTLGGNVATNAGGIRGAKYGVTKDYVLGLQVVLPDGRITRTGSACMKSVSGYDLTRLFVGSEGTLGVVTEITLKVNPKPAAFKTALASFAALIDAGNAVTRIMRSGIIPSVLEILDENTIRVLREQGGMNLPEVEALILAETDGYTHAETDYQMRRIVEAFKANGSTDIQVAETREASEKLWQIRKSASSTAASLRPNNVSEDVTVPMSQVPNLLAGVSRICRGYGLVFVIFGHAGDGNLHPKIMYDAMNPEEARRVHRASEEIFRLAIQLGGTLTGEHGIGLAKAPYMKFEHDPIAMEVMRSLKRLFDPNNILNPGKMNLEEAES